MLANGQIERHAGWQAGRLADRQAVRQAACHSKTCMQSVCCAAWQCVCRYLTLTTRKQGCLILVVELLPFRIDFSRRDRFECFRL